MKKQLDELIRNDRSLKVENKNAIPKMKHKRRCLKIILSIVTIFLVLLILAYIFVPTIADKKLNAVLNDPPYSYSEKAKAAHSDLFVADLHADSLLTNRDLLKENSYGQIDIPRLIKGNVALQVFAVPSKVPISINIDKNSDEGDVLGVLAFLQRWPVITWWSAKEKALYQSEKLHKFEEKSNGKLEIIKTSSQLKRYIEKRKLHSQRTSAILAIEGAHVLENSIDNVNIFYNAGFRIVGLAHYFDNEVGGSAHGIDKGGLTKFGKKVINRMEELNMIVDLAHSSPKLMNDVLNITTRPVIVSHTGVKGVVNNNRNLSDQQIKKIAEKQGVIGIGYWQRAIGGNDAKAIVKSIRYVAELVGVEHVALGSDFDGSIRAPFDSTGVPEITEELLNQGFSHDDISLIMGGNVVKLLMKTLPK